MNGWVRVDWEYEVDGVLYHKAASVTPNTAEELAENPDVCLIVDPRRPACCMLAQDVLLDAGSDEERSD